MKWVGNLEKKIEKGKVEKTRGQVEKQMQELNKQ